MTNIIKIPVPVSATYIADGGRKEKIETFLKEMEFTIKNAENLNRVFYMKMQNESEYSVFKTDDAKLLFPISGTLVKPGGNNFQKEYIKGVTINDLELMIDQKIKHNICFDYVKSNSMDLYNNLIANTLNYADAEPIIPGDNKIRKMPENVKEWTGSNENYLLNRIQKIFDRFLLFDGYIISETAFPQSLSGKTAGNLLTFSTHPLGIREKILNHSIFTNSNRDYDYIKEYEFKEEEYYDLVKIDFIIEKINNKITDAFKSRDVWNHNDVFYNFVQIKNSMEDFYINQNALYFVSAMKELINKEPFYSFCEGERLFEDINTDLNAIEKLLSNPEYKTNMSLGYKM